LLAFLKVSESQVLANRHQHIWHTTDLYTRQGKQFKTPLGMDFNQARTFAQRDLLVNWQEYRRIFLGE
jgi:hypothetical protein